MMDTTTTPAMGLSVEPEALAVLAKQCLEEEGTYHTNKYRYTVSINWLDSWKKFTGQTKPFSPGVVKVPGPVEQDLKDPERNEYVDGKLWRHLIHWYGLHPTHELDRQRCGDDRNDKPEPMDFSIGVMSPVTELVKRKIKSLNVKEDVGYIECQLRQILGVSAQTQTRLWYKKKDSDSGYQLICDRYQELSTAIKELGEGLTQGVIDKLNLEICNSRGDWPTGYVTQVRGKLESYAEVTVGGQMSSIALDNLLCENTGHQLREMHDHLQTQIARVKRLEETYNQQQRHIAHELNLVFEEKKKQDQRKKNLKMKEDTLKGQESDVERKREQLQHDMEEYENELNRVQQLNAMTENKITLNVGGQYFTTSLPTLTAIGDTFFACMFSGRYPLIKCPDDSYFLDRDGTTFHYILEYLRNGKLDIQAFVDAGNTNALRHIMVEADFYNLTDLYNEIRMELRLDYTDLFQTFQNLASLQDDVFEEL